MVAVDGLMVLGRPEKIQICRKPHDTDRHGCARCGARPCRRSCTGSHRASACACCPCCRRASVRRPPRRRRSPYRGGDGSRSLAGLDESSLTTRRAPKWMLSGLKYSAKEKWNRLRSQPRLLVPRPALSILLSIGHLAVRAMYLLLQGACPGAGLPHARPRRWSRVRSVSRAPFLRSASALAQGERVSS